MSGDESASDPLALTVTGHNPPAVVAVGIAPGGTLDRYRIVRRLGEGGMGIVYEAHDTELDRRVALKVLRRPARGASPEAVERRARLVREAQALARVSHAHVVQVFDAGTVNEDVFVAMELVDGENLSAWLAAHRRNWREIIDVFVQAARGLAEAHQAGLVHRDFKPSNVIVGKDGRVRVLDFGLARAVETVNASAHGASTPSLLESPLTVEGALLGTPMYMAPEQWVGGVVDARSDQYSVCASLWEALAGQPPFEGSTVTELEHAIVAGKLRPFPADARAPRRLVAATLRGLRVDPRARFASIDELITELSRIRRFRRRAVTLAATATVLGATAIAAFAVGRSAVVEATITCAGAEARLAGVWDAPVKAKVRAAFATSSWSGAAATFDSIAKRLDSYADGWATMRTYACEATQRGEQSAELLDLRMSCLDQRRGELGALAELFARADPAVVFKAVSATVELTPLAVCEDSAALRQLIPLPTDPAARARIATVRGLLDRGRVLRQAGKYADGLELVRPLQKEATAIGYAPVEAETLYVLAELEDWGGDASVAEALYRRTAALAGEAGDDRLMANAWAALVFVIGILQGRHAEALQVSEFAAPAAARSRDVAIAAKLHNNIGAVHNVLGQLDLAAKELELAVKQREASLGPDHPALASSLANLGAVKQNQLDFEAAERLGQRSLAIRRRVLGVDHPEVGQNLTNLGALASARGDQAGALELAVQALAIARKAYGDTPHIHTGESLNNAGSYALELGHYAEAAQFYEHAVAVFRAILPATHPHLGNALTGQAESLVHLGRPGPAVPFGEEAVAIHSNPGATPMALANARFALGIALAESGKDRTRGRQLVVLAHDAYAAAKAEKWRAAAAAWLAKK